ncbi:MAG: hypothetical protein KDD61_08850 [Bdellovibrionales bacterium]|nr:hypothetical protein [Bdellovibrionales bacterium]
MNKKLLTIAPAIVLGLTLNAHAAKVAGGFEVGAETSIDYSRGENNEGTLTSRGIQFNIGRSLSESVRADLALDLAEALGRDFRLDGEDQSMDFDLDKLVDELKVTAMLQDGKIKVSIGKMHIDMTANDQYGGPKSKDLLYDTKKLRQVVGVVVTANPAILSKIIDEVSVFASEAADGGYDMDISSGEFSVGIKVTKQLTESLKLEAAHAELRTESSDSDGKSVSSIGATWNSSIIAAYGTIIVTQDDLQDEKTTQYQIGVKRNQWSADFTDDDKNRRYQVAYDMDLDSKGNIKLKPYVSYTTSNNKGEEDLGAEAGLELNARFH